MHVGKLSGPSHSVLLQKQCGSWRQLAGHPGLFLGLTVGWREGLQPSLIMSSSVFEWVLQQGKLGKRAPFVPSCMSR